MVPFSLNTQLSATLDTQKCKRFWKFPSATWFSWEDANLVYISDVFCASNPPISLSIYIRSLASKKNPQNYNGLFAPKPRNNLTSPTLF